MACVEPGCFACAALDALPQHVAVLDARGDILAVNRAWREFAEANSLLPAALCEGSNYLAACASATGEDAEYAARFTAGLRAVFAGGAEEFALEYPCHAPAERRWFIARVKRFEFEGEARAVVTHANLTARKEAEEDLREAYAELERHVEERTAELARSNETLRAENAERLRAEDARRELLRRLVTAQEQERRRISQELHDQMGQQLAALMIGLKTLDADSYGRQAALATLRQLQGLTGQLSREVHTLAWGLRPPALDDLGLRTALFNYVEEWAERSRVAVDFHSSGFGGERLPFSHETALYRIAQEALTNVLKHSGADRLSVILERRADHVLAVVEDNGRGFDAEAPARGRRLGLVGMRERAELLGGTLNIESTPGVGTSVFVRIPVGAAGQGGEEQRG